MKINLNTPLIDISGNKVKCETLAKILANQLQASFKAIEPIRAISIATKLWNDGSADIEKDELEKIKNEIKKSEYISTLVKARIEEAIIDCLNDKTT